MLLTGCQEDANVIEQDLEETQPMSVAVGDAFSVSFDIEKTVDKTTNENEITRQKHFDEKCFCRN